MGKEEWSSSTNTVWFAISLLRDIHEAKHIYRNICRVTAHCLESATASRPMALVSSDLCKHMTASTARLCIRWLEIQRIMQLGDNKIIYSLKKAHITPRRFVSDAKCDYVRIASTFGELRHHSRALPFLLLLPFGSTSSSLSSWQWCRPRGTTLHDIVSLHQVKMIHTQGSVWPNDPVLQIGVRHPRLWWMLPMPCISVWEASISQLPLFQSELESKYWTQYIFRASSLSQLLPCFLFFIICSSSFHLLRYTMTSM